MSLASNTPTNQRALKDGTFVKVASSLGGTSGATAGFNLVQSLPYPTTEQVVLKVETTALAGSNTTASFFVQESEDNSTYTNIAEFATQTLTVPTTRAATTYNYILPPDVKQYVRVSSSVSGATTGGYTASLAF